MKRNSLGESSHYRTAPNYQMTVEFIDENGGVRSANHYVLVDELERSPAENGIVLARLVEPLLPPRTLVGSGQTFLVDA
jgi:hypothetical protein